MGDAAGRQPGGRGGAPCGNAVGVRGHGGALVVSIESLHNALARARQAEHGRAAALAEYRHRSRNDLQSLVGLILLRARGASVETQAALREAAGHALALAAVHSSLAASALPGGAAVVDAGALVHGICRGLAHPGADNASPDKTGAAGLSLAAVVVEAETWPISAERGVSFGLLLHRCVWLARRGAYPDGGGVVHVRFWRCGDRFRLEVEDAGRGMPAATGPSLGSRMLRALGAQLRGTFERGPGRDGGTRCVLIFPAAEP